MRVDEAQSPAALAWHPEAEHEYQDTQHPINDELAWTACIYRETGTKTPGIHEMSQCGMSGSIERGVLGFMSSNITLWDRDNITA